MSLKRDFGEVGAAQQESVAGLLRRFGALGFQLLVLFVLSVFPFKFLHLAEVRPSFLLMAVYYWAVFRPQTLSPLAAFLTGLLLDLLSAGPLGLNALTLLGARQLTGRQRRFLVGQSFPVLWMCFFLVAALAFAAQWAVFSLFSMTLMAPRPMLISAALTGLFFPPVAWALSAFGKASQQRASSLS
jgi:rod shape-determining protein MreD